MQNDASLQSDKPSVEIIEQDQLLTPQQRRFYASDQYAEARKALEEIEQNAQYDTSLLHKGNNLPFVERHLYNLSLRPNVELNGYISNLKLMTRVRNP